jgi:tight adherence protein C
MTMLSGPYLAAGLAAISIFAGVIALAMPASPDARLKARLRSVARERDRLRSRRLAELSAREAKDRLRLQPRGIMAHVAALWPGAPGEAAGDLAVRLKMAGLRGPGPEALFFFCRAALPALFFAAIFALGLLKGQQLGRTFVFAAAGALVGYALPRLALARLIARRQKAILRAFPDGLDLLLICIHAGMSVEAALARVTSEISSQCIELAEELGLTMAELSYLTCRWRAYHNLGERTGLAQVKLIAAALAQAERYGTPISQALAAAGRECREMRLFEAERKAAALPPKLTVPLVLFFLPVLMGVILAPAGMQVTKVWKDRPGARGSNLTFESQPEPPTDSNVRSIRSTNKNAGGSDREKTTP